MGFREDIFACVSAIPKETVPCHRVVHSDGSLGRNYAFGGPKVQKENLIAEGVRFIGDRVDMDICRAEAVIF